MHGEIRRFIILQHVVRIYTPLRAGHLSTEYTFAVWFSSLVLNLEQLRHVCVVLQIILLYEIFPSFLIFIYGQHMLNNLVKPGTEFTLFLVQKS